MHTKLLALKTVGGETNDQVVVTLEHAPRTEVECNPDAALGLLSEIVLGMRRSFCDYVRALPAPCGHDLIRHFTARLARSGGRPVLGEYAPLLLCDILGIPTQRAHELGVPWLMLYEASALTDDLADLQVEDRESAAFLLQFAFTEALFCWRNYLEQFPFLWTELRRFQQEAVSAAYSELDLRHAQNDSLAGELAFGKKPALAKFCAAALCAVGSSRRLTQEENDGLDELCMAVQLLDDITDCGSDLRLRQPNYVASAIVGWLRRLRGSARLDSSEISEEEAMACLVFSGTLTRVARFVVDCTHRGVNLLRVSDRTLTMDYFRSQVASCKRLIEAERRLRVFYPEAMMAAKRALAQNAGVYHRFLGTPVGAIAGQRIRECHSLMPRASQ